MTAKKEQRKGKNRRSIRGRGRMYPQWILEHVPLGAERIYAELFSLETRYEKSAFPSIAHLMEVCCCGRTFVKNALASLEECGAIAIEHSAGKYSRYSTVFDRTGSYRDPVAGLDRFSENSPAVAEEPGGLTGSYRDHVNNRSNVRPQTSFESGARGAALLSQKPSPKPSPKQRLIASWCRAWKSSSPGRGSYVVTDPEAGQLNHMKLADFDVESFGPKAIAYLKKLGYPITLSAALKGINRFDDEIPEIALQAKKLSKQDIYELEIRLKERRDDLVFKNGAPKTLQAEIDDIQSQLSQARE